MRIVKGKLPFRSNREVTIVFRRFETDTMRELCTVHHHPARGEALMGWRVKATYPIGPTRDLKWHDLFVIKVLTDPASPDGFKYQLFCPLDSDDDYVTGVQDCVCYRGRAPSRGYEGH